MMLSDCPDCWDTPCTCGSGYKDWSIQRLMEQIEMLKGVLARKMASFTEGRRDTRNSRR